ncbi:hypothetical protein DPMN_156456, partial [Dreissena polymorpha]
MEKGLYACGTVRVNRKGFPCQLKKPADVRQRGDFKIMQMGDTNLAATVWKDKRLVHHLSTLREPTVILPAQRRCGTNLLQLQQPHSHVVALLMEKGPDLVFYWMGLAKIGAIGTSLVGWETLEAFLKFPVPRTRIEPGTSVMVDQSVTTLPPHHPDQLQPEGEIAAALFTGCTGAVCGFSEEMAPAVADISRDIPKSCSLYYMGSGQCPVVGAVSLDPLLEKSPTCTPPAHVTKFTETNVLLVASVVIPLVGKIFDGYVSKEATDKKMAITVFKKGDMTFLTVGVT